MVLRRRTEHGGTADVDVLDGLFAADPWLRNGAFERIKVHHDEVDRFDTVLLHLAHVLRQVRTPQQSSVDLRVQSFHAPVQDLREPDDVGDGVCFDAGLPQGG